MMSSVAHAQEEFLPSDWGITAILLYEGATKFDSVVKGNLFGFQW